jgi:hypothetical protein
MEQAQTLQGFFCCRTRFVARGASWKSTGVGQALSILDSLSPAICDTGKNAFDDVPSGGPREMWVRKTWRGIVRKIVGEHQEWRDERQYDASQREQTVTGRYPLNGSSSLSMRNIL